MKDLLSRIASDRSDEAFRQLFDEYGPRVRSFMMRQGADPELADELTQETVRRIAAIRATDEAREGLRSFLEKRKPTWLTQS